MKELARNFTIRDSEKPVIPAGTGLGGADSAQPGGDWSPTQLTGLAAALEREIIPRLVLAQRAVNTAAAATPEIAPAAADVAAFAETLLGSSAPAVSAFVAAQIERGTSIETLYLELMAPAARRLGDLWLDDACDMAEVSLALYRLQQQLHRLSHVFQCGREQSCIDRRVLLCMVPGEHHIFGAMMTAEFFFRAGWSVRSEFPGSNEAMASLMHSGWYDVVILSLSCSLMREHRLKPMSSAVQAIHRSSRNRDVGIIAEGRVFTEHPELALSVGADAVAIDPRHAVLQAASTLALLPSRFRDGEAINAR
jgi:methanogenic corrinoid protein MtbC1